jgi:hypothetical protein
MLCFRCLQPWRAPWTLRLGNVVFWNMKRTTFLTKDETMDNVQEYNNCTLFPKFSRQWNKIDDMCIFHPFVVNNKQSPERLQENRDSGFYSKISRLRENKSLDWDQTRLGYLSRYRDGLRGQTDAAPFPAGAWDFSLLHSVQTWPAAHLSSYPISTWVISSGVKRQVCETDNSSPTSAEVKNGGGITPLPHMSSWHNA